MYKDAHTGSFRRCCYGYVLDLLDAGAGPANCMHYSFDGHEMLIASNRETDEVALYELEQ